MTIEQLIDQLTLAAERVGLQAPVTAWLLTPVDDPPLRPLQTIPVTGAFAGVQDGTGIATLKLELTP